MLFINSAVFVSLNLVVLQHCFPFEHTDSFMFLSLVFADCIDCHKLTFIINERH